MSSKKSPATEPASTRRPQSSSGAAGVSESAAEIGFARVAFNLLVALLLGLLFWAVLDLPPQSAGLHSKVKAHMHVSGVASPITAVLLNFRGYDTLLEIVVLLLASIGCLILRDAPQSHPASAPGQPGEWVLDGMIHVLIPVMLLTAGYLLWAGDHAPGGAFQAGAVLAAAGFLLVLGNRMRFWRTPEWLLRLSLSFGMIVFVLVASLVTILTKNLLQYPENYASILILLIETSVAGSIGCVLITLFAGHPPVTRTPAADQLWHSNDEPKE